VVAHEHTEESLARQVRRAEETAQDIMAAEKAVAAGADPDVEFPVNPGSLCGWCDFRKVCPAGAEAVAKEPWTAVEHLSPSPGSAGQAG
jgi:putative RecB family exonuclease